MSRFAFLSLPFLLLTRLSLFPTPLPPVLRILSRPDVSSTTLAPQNSFWRRQLFAKIRFDFDFRANEHVSFGGFLKNDGRTVSWASTNEAAEVHFQLTHLRSPSAASMGLMGIQSHLQALIVF